MQVYPNVLIKFDFVISKGVVRKAQLFWNINLKNFQNLKDVYKNKNKNNH